MRMKAEMEQEQQMQDAESDERTRSTAPNRKLDIEEKKVETNEEINRRLYIAAFSIQTFGRCMWTCAHPRGGKEVC